MAGDAGLPQDEARFFAQVRPALEEAETRRCGHLERLGARKRRAKIAGLCLAPLTLLADGVLVFGFGDAAVPLATFLMVCALFWWTTEPKRAYIREYKKTTLPRIAQALGLSYDPRGRIPAAEIRAAKILPHHDRCTMEDYFEGAYKGAHIRLVETLLEERRRSGKRTYYVPVFRGLVIGIRLPRDRFHGHTVVLPDAPGLAEWVQGKTSGLKRANLVDPEFEKKYTVFTTDQVEARYILDPLMMERVRTLWMTSPSERVSMAFYGDNVFILAPARKNLFEPASIHTSVLDAESFHTVWADLRNALRFVDQLEFCPD